MQTKDNDNNTNFKFIGQIATYKINNIFTECTNNQIEQSYIHKMETLAFYFLFDHD